MSRRTILYGLATLGAVVGVVALGPAATVALAAAVALTALACRDPEGWGKRPDPAPWSVGPNGRLVCPDAQRRSTHSDPTPWGIGPDGRLAVRVRPSEPSAPRHPT